MFYSATHDTLRECLTALVIIFSSVLMLARVKRPDPTWHLAAISQPWDFVATFNPLFILSRDGLLIFSRQPTLAHLSLSLFLDCSYRGNSLHNAYCPNTKRWKGSEAEASNTRERERERGGGEAIVVQECNLNFRTDPPRSGELSANAYNFKSACVALSRIMQSSSPQCSTDSALAGYSSVPESAPRMQHGVAMSSARSGRIEVTV